MEVDNQELQQALDNIDSQVTDATKDTLNLLMERVLKQGMRPKTALQLSDEVMEGIYSHAYNMYNRGMYDESSHIFRLLTLLDPAEGKYVMGLAACMHMLKAYEDAIGIYILCSSFDSKNPLPHYHAADCYIKLDCPTEACFELSEAIHAAGKDEQYAVLVERAQLMMESLAEESVLTQEDFKKIRKEAKKEAKKMDSFVKTIQEAQEESKKQASAAEKPKKKKKKKKVKKKLD